MTHSPFCSDFGFSTEPMTAAQIACEAAGEAVVGASLNSVDWKYFRQGFTHGMQGRTDLVGECHPYDLGHAAGAAYAAQE